MVQLRLCLELLMIDIKRWLVTAVLFLLPSKAIWIYIEIALTTIFVTNKGGREDVDMVEFFRLVNNDYDEHQISLPANSINFMWGPEVMDTLKSFITGENTIREVIKDDKLLARNMDRVIDSMLVNLPGLLKLRLGVSSEPKREMMRNNIIECLDRKFEVSGLYW